MKFKVNKGPFLRDKRTTTKIMLELFAVLCVVWIASIVFYSIKFGAMGGLRVFGVGGVSILATLVVDIIVALIKGKRTFKDICLFTLKSYSYVTALIFALCLPAGTSFYVVVLGALFATIIGKYVFGGFGNNIFNPAIMGRIFVGLAFSDKLNILQKTSKEIDVVSGATFTSTIDWVTGVNSGKVSLLNMFLGNYQGAIGETFTALLIVLAIYLIVRGIINYRLFAGYLVTAVLCSLGIGLVNKANNLGEYLLTSISAGGLMFAAVFMITDPVTSPKSQDGKIIYASLAGFLSIFIRVFSSYPEGVMFSIALANMVTPLIDSAIRGNTFDHLPTRITRLVAVPVVSMLISCGYAAIPFDSENGEGLPKTSTRSGNAPIKVDTGVTKISDSLYEVVKKGISGDVKLVVRIDIFAKKITSIAATTAAGEYDSDWTTGSYVGDNLNLDFSELDAFDCSGSVCVKDANSDSAYDITSGATYTSSAAIKGLKAIVDEVKGEKKVSIVKESSNVYTVTKEGLDGPITIEFEVDDTGIISAEVKSSDPREYWEEGIENFPKYESWFNNAYIPFTDIDAFVLTKNKYVKGDTETDIDVVTNSTVTSNAIVEAFKEVVDAKRGEAK